MSDKTLDSAYSIAGPEDCLRIYGEWAHTYDDDFAAGMDYRLPALVGAAFLAAGGEGPVLDVGAGTGLLAVALTSMGFRDEIDGLDLSPAMLARAGEKGLYRSLLQADITRPLPRNGAYQGVVSSGTFTHGHVGPEALPHLFATALPEAVFALSVNAAVWVSLGFDRAMKGLPGLTLSEVPVYGEAAARQGAAHAGDRAVIAVFRRP
ncbi:class I SAM-dependent DNA methyltransferase [Neotabrizicola shimadae]|uniref:Class I SAM-dependent methyltransferase n=1 Tax=Neotabrizicola shimadae TaxID=2807096 RepID=A0A8G0ZQ96_9RHOB|nr:class I SAM-dependent methyltransferase [Neotabrizicola shimadae]QYZ69481.1 class I SAM-dependent methyltransferase [Neotabrizicola shimadae]